MRELMAVYACPYDDCSVISSTSGKTCPKHNLLLIRTTYRRVRTAPKKAEQKNQESFNALAAFGKAFFDNFGKPSKP